MAATVAAILCTGSELTRGELVNTNATWLAEALTTLGFVVAAIDAVPDDRAGIISALERLAKQHAVIVCTGGLGPTTDDLTSSTVAELLGVPLVRDEVSLAQLAARFARAGRSMAASNAKQADFPAGATILPNPEGTAPGFSVRLGQAVAFFLPGVPSEMKAMFGASVVPAIEPALGDRQHQVRLATYGLPESEVNDRLAGIEAAHDVTLGYRARMPTIEVKVLARASTAEQARTRAESAAREVRHRLGEAVYGEGDAGFVETLLGELETKGLTLALAESCTGGLVAELVTRVPGASRVFRGSVVAYANEVKTSELGVAPALIAAHGAVSEEVARAMAEGARSRFGAALGLSFTGIAGPDGGTPEKPVGLVHFALASERGVSAKQAIFLGNREQVRRRAAFAGLALVRRSFGAGELG
jgi:nicotinamide-nucleotide amidase